jgi:hypothetical protein
VSRNPVTELVAHLRSLPDDWDSWLVLADALSDTGDVRGQLLVLEHGREDIAVLADDWLGTWCYQLADDDVETYQALRELGPLARRAPSELAPVYAQPLSQLLALLEPRVEPRAGVSPVLALQRRRAIAATLAWIDRAFDGVPAPDLDHRTLHQAEAADNYESCDRSRDHLGRWQELPDEQLLANQWALAHLDAQGLHYYTPAVMSFALRNGSQHAGDLWITESLEYTLQPSATHLRDYQLERFALFEREQRAAIYAFTCVAGHRVAADAWRRVLVAAHAAHVDHWFERFNPRT